MTIQNIIDGYNGSRRILDRPVCQFLTDTGGRCIYRFAVDDQGIYLEKKVTGGYKMLEESEVQLEDEDVTETLLSHFQRFLAEGGVDYGVFADGATTPASGLFSADFLEGHELASKDFLTY